MLDEDRHGRQKRGYLAITLVGEASTSHPDKYFCLPFMRLLMKNRSEKIRWPRPVAAQLGFP